MKEKVLKGLFKKLEEFEATHTERNRQELYFLFDTIIYNMLLEFISFTDIKLSVEKTDKFITVIFLLKRGILIEMVDPSDWIIRDGIVPQIVDKETWEKVNGLLDNKRSEAREDRKTGKHLGTSLLSNKLFCGYCDSVFYSASRDIKKRGESAYRILE